MFEPERDTPFDPCLIKQMADQIRHRGPDDEGVHVAPGIGLGHRRLSIIDVSGGHQPLANEDGTVWIAFNGEIYNFQDLKDKFLSGKHQFRTRSDTETIVHLYEELGESCFAEMRGMFALALWDAKRKALILARDRVGKKPLFYSWDGRRLIFGSEIKAMWPAEVSREMDLTALADYFCFGYVPAPKTIYKHIRKLKPASYLVCDNSGIRETAYWDLRFDETSECSEETWCERFLDEYRVAVKSRLISEVPLGAFLSGGIDSTSVVAIMNEHQRPVTTCSIGFAEQAYDEAAAARSFARSVGANHFEQEVKPAAIELLPRLAWHYDEPFADSSAIPTYYVCQMAREHVTVALSGDGGDENFAGYRRYRLTMWEQRLRDLVPAPVRKTVVKQAGAWYPSLAWAPRVFRAKATLQSLARDPLDGYFVGFSCCPPELRPHVFAPDVLSALNGYDPLELMRTYYERAGTSDHLSRLQYVDVKTYLTDDILAKVDRASMANSLEVRCPLLDHKVMELVAQMPSSLKLRNGQGKYLFKKALRGVVPNDVLDRPKKGFAVPISEWFRSELKQFAGDVIFGADDHLLNRAFLETCWEQHQRRVRDWSALLWSVLMFRTWQEACSKP